MQPHETHRLYGRRMRSHAETREVFGEVADSKEQGGVRKTRQGVVGMILVYNKSKYPNVIERDTISYCFPPAIDKKVAMQHAYHDQTAFRVMIQDGRPLGYDWGLATIKSVDNTRKRYDIVRIEEHPHGLQQSEATEPEPAKATGPEPTTASAEPTTATTTMATTTMMVTTESAESAEPTTTVATAQAYGIWNKNHFEIFDRNTRYDSALEWRTSILMETLGISFIAKGIPHFGVKYQGAGHDYTPDFTLYDAIDGSPTDLEIKPQFPYDDELRKCEQVVAQRHTPMVLMYGEPTIACFSADAGKHSGYEHARGMRGIRFDWDQSKQRVVISHDAAFACEPADGSRPGIRVRSRPDDDTDHFENQWLKRARTAAYDCSYIEIPDHKSLPE
tara:strand:- start:100 stop:1269 length:1170 start_codon:yes stop_codon:yes gene_type:complete